MMMSIILEQAGIIEKLIWHNKHLITLLGQYMDVEAEEKKLEDALNAELKDVLKDKRI